MRWFLDFYVMHESCRENTKKGPNGQDQCWDHPPQPGLRQGYCPPTPQPGPGYPSCIHAGLRFVLDSCSNFDVHLLLIDWIFMLHFKVMSPINGCTRVHHLIFSYFVLVSKVRKAFFREKKKRKNATTLNLTWNNKYKETKSSTTQQHTFLKQSAHYQSKY